MLNPPSTRELKKAFQLLFNSDGVSETGYFIDLELPELQKAFRRKALETHPDRSKIVGKSEAEMVRRFNEVSTAYELLKPIVQNGIKIASIDPETPPQKNHYYQGVIPQFEMTVGQFLYYSGMISWKTYISAIVWENKRCPRFGQIAKTWNMLSPEEIMEILKEKTCREKFGEYALRTGYLTLFQQMAIIGRQRILKPPPGQYFLEKGLFSSEQIDRIQESTLLHNQNQRPMNRKWK